jgi:LEA14-like dessication related protein
MIRMKFSSRAGVWIALLVLVASGCVPREDVKLRAVNINEVVPGGNGIGTLKADAIFYNPNSSRMRLKKINIEIFVDGKKAGTVDQELSSLIKAKSEFTIPLEVKLNLNEIGLLDTLLSLFGGKTHEIRFTGEIKMKVNGWPVKAPLDFKQEFKF